MNSSMMSKYLNIDMLYMGHSTKKMVDEVYGTYRQGLVDEKERIIDYRGGFPGTGRVEGIISGALPGTNGGQQPCS